MRGGSEVKRGFGAPEVLLLDHMSASFIAYCCFLAALMAAAFETPPMIFAWLVAKRLARPTPGPSFWCILPVIGVTVMWYMATALWLAPKTGDWRIAINAFVTFLMIVWVFRLGFWRSVVASAVYCASSWILVYVYPFVYGVMLVILSHH